MKNTRISHNNKLQAIVTKRLPFSATKGDRIKATCFGGSVTMKCGSDLSAIVNHGAACFKLVEKMGWGGHWVVGGLPDGKSNVYVNVGSED